ncbi:MAG TPA: carotenoid oxygenase family protein [Mycobacterium sp.]|nr:carotenoid oxygenase family protein [Mycobacterium sp.]
MTAQLNAPTLKPGTQTYLNSLTEPERLAAQRRLSALPADDIAALGVSEPLHLEYDYELAETTGELPAGLRGTLYRNGPGRWEDYRHRPLRHLFDGDGMVSRFVIEDGRVHYRNRYVHTRHYRAKGPTRHLGTPAPGGWLANMIAPAPPNLANTNIIRHAGRLFALWEGGPPYELDPTTLETRGARRFGGRLHWIGSYSAHPSVCPRTGEMYNFGVELFPTAHLRIYAMNSAGRMRHFGSVKLPYPAMVHDFAMTESQLVFVISPMIPDVIPVVTARKTIGEALRYRPEKGSVIILVDRSNGQTRSVETDTVLQFHLSNAYEHAGDTVIDAITYADGEIVGCIADFRTRSLAEAPSEFTRLTVTARGTVRRERISNTVCEFPRHHPDREGTPHRYAYIASRHRLGSLYDAVTKIDLQTQTEHTHHCERAGNSFCEPVFTPRPDAVDEDDGWLLTVEYEADQHRSRLVVLDARDVAAGPVFTAALTHHIPQGFHGNFYAG